MTKHKISKNTILDFCKFEPRSPKDIKEELKKFDSRNEKIRSDNLNKNYLKKHLNSRELFKITKEYTHLKELKKKKIKIKGKGLYIQTPYSAKLFLMFSKRINKIRVLIEIETRVELEHYFQKFIKCCQEIEAFMMIEKTPVNLKEVRAELEKEIKAQTEGKNQPEIKRILENMNYFEKAEFKVNVEERTVFDPSVYYEIEKEDYNKKLRIQIEPLLTSPLLIQRKIEFVDGFQIPDYWEEFEYNIEQYESLFLKELEHFEEIVRAKTIVNEVT